MTDTETFLGIITICVVLVTLSYFGFFRWLRYEFDWGLFWAIVLGIFLLGVGYYIYLTEFKSSPNFTITIICVALVILFYIFRGSISDIFFRFFDYTGQLDEGRDLDYDAFKAGKITHPSKLVKITHPNGLVQEGAFDKDTGNLIEGKVIFPNGNVEEGMRDNATGFLIEGKIILPDGQVQEGKFDKDTGNFIKGKAIFPNGRIEEGTRDKDTGYFIEGKITYPDGRIEEGKFDKDTGKLIEE